MALPETNISTTLVRNTLGAGTNKVSELCAHANVNMRSAKKPHDRRSIVHSGYFNSEVVQSHGLYRAVNLATDPPIIYRKPVGGADSYYALGDFRGYNHATQAPSRIEILSIKEGVDEIYNSSGVTTLIQGVEYEFTIKAHKGEVDPLLIYNRTGWTKPTQDEGYGGVTLLPYDEEVKIVSEDAVVSVGDLNDTATVSITVLSLGNVVVDAFYCEKYIAQLQPQIIAYRSLGLRIEDRSHLDKLNAIIFPCGIRGYVQRSGSNYQFKYTLENTSDRDFLVTVKVHSTVGSGTYTQTFNHNLAANTPFPNENFIFWTTEPNILAQPGQTYTATFELIFLNSVLKTAIKQVAY